MLASHPVRRVALTCRIVAVTAIDLLAPNVASAQGPDLAAAKKCFEDQWVRHDTTAVIRCSAPSYTDHGTAGDTTTTHASQIAFLKSVFEAYPDMKGTILEQLPHGDRIITRWRVVGTNKNTKKQLAMNGIAIDRIVGGKTVESWGAFDNLPVLISQGYTITPPKQ